MVLMISRRHPHIDAREQRENIRLNSGNEDLDQIDKQDNQTRDASDDVALENKRKRYQA